MNSGQNNKKLINDSIIKDISDLVQKLEYGTIEIKLHNSKIVQVEVAEKKRFDDVWHIEGGGI